MLEFSDKSGRKEVVPKYQGKVHLSHLEHECSNTIRSARGRKQIASLRQSYFLLEKYIIKEAPERQSSSGEADLTGTGYPNDERAGSRRTQETFCLQ